MSEFTSREIWLLMNSNAYMLLHKDDISPEVWSERMELDKKLQLAFNATKKKERKGL